MRKMKIVVRGHGVATCLDQWKAIKRIKHMDPLNWADRAYHGNGYIGFNLETDAIVEHPGPTTIELYEVMRDNTLSLEELRNRFWQNWKRLQIEIKERVKSFYDQNCIIS